MLDLFLIEFSLLPSYEFLRAQSILMETLALLIVEFRPTGTLLVVGWPLHQCVHLFTYHQLSVLLEALEHDLIVLISQPTWWSL